MKSTKLFAHHKIEIGVKNLRKLWDYEKYVLWYQKYLENGYEGLKRPKEPPKDNGTAYLKNKKDLVVEIALEHTELSSKNWHTKLPMSKINFHLRIQCLQGF